MKLRWYGDKITKQVHKQAGDAVYKAAEELLGRANKTVPHQEGDLEGSGEVDVDRKEIIATVSYDTKYALRLHENPQYNFLKGRRGKWLELTTQEESKELGKFITNELKKAFR